MDPRARAKIALRSLLRRAGLDLVRALDEDNLLRRRSRLIEAHRINLLLDVGASAGQYVMTMRALGFEGRVVSYEPVRESYELLERAAAADRNWTAVHAAIGDRAGTATIHVSNNAQSSSLLPMLQSHVEAAPDSHYIRDEEVVVITLASALQDHVGASERLFLKLDTQGTEMAVLGSGGERLQDIVGLQIELSTVPLYGGQPLMEEVVTRLRELGFTPMAFEPDFWDAVSGQLLQLDGIFFRE